MRTIVAPAVMAVLFLAATSPRAQAQVPVGGEFQVNTYTTGNQGRPAVGMAPGGEFIVAWEGVSLDGDDVMAQRYDASGAVQGPNFRVNTYTTNDQQRMAVAVAGDGSFVVVWENLGGAFGVSGQRYDPIGNASGGEFQVNAHTMSGLPSVVIAPDKSFVVVWGSKYEVPGGLAETFAQRFNAAGSRIGGEFLVNTYTTGYQIPVRNGPAVAMDAAGNFVVVWTSLDPAGAGQDGSSGSVHAQRFGSSGSRLGGEFQVNTYTTNGQYYPTVAMAPSGQFVVAWASDLGQDGSAYGVFGQRFSASGSRLGAEFQVNTYTTGNQYDAIVTADNQGNFVVVWESQGDVIARRFASNGNPREAEFRVNTYTPFPQGGAFIASDAVGNFTVAWDSYPQDGSGLGVFAQRFVSDLIFRSGFDPTNP